MNLIRSDKGSLAKQAGTGRGCKITAGPKRTYAGFELMTAVAAPTQDTAANGDHEKVIASSTSTFTPLEENVGAILDFTFGDNVGVGKYKAVCTIKDSEDNALVLTYKIKSLGKKRFSCFLPIVGVDGKLVKVHHGKATAAASTQSCVWVVTGADGTGYTAEAVNGKNSEITDYFND